MATAIESNIEDQNQSEFSCKSEFSGKSKEQICELGTRHFERKRREAVRRKMRPVSYDGQIHESIRKVARLKCCAEGTVKKAIERGYFHGEEGKVVKWA
ncbi:MAG: hypothetical protein ACPGJV_02645 [Bacteriovoracaceae bacterium]